RAFHAAPVTSHALPSFWKCYEQLPKHIQHLADKNFALFTKAKRSRRNPVVEPRRNLTGLKAWPRGFRPLCCSLGFVGNDASAKRRWNGQSSSLRLRNDPQIWLRRFPTLRVTPLRFLVGHRAGDDHVLPRQPVLGRGDLVLRGELQ